MAKTSKIYSNLRREQLAKTAKEKRETLLKLTKDVNLSFEERMAARHRLERMPRDSSKIRHRNRCQITGRPRGVLSKFKLGRILFRDMALRGELPGVIKASW